MCVTEKKQLMRAPDFLLFVVVMTAVSFLPALYVRFKKEQMRHQERMTALEKGAELPPLQLERAEAPWSPLVYLLRGLIWLFCGMGLSASALGIAQGTKHEEPLEWRMERAQDLRQRGVPEVEVQKLMNSSRELKALPEGAALLGLIPFGVGLAYLIFYREEKKYALPNA